MPTSAQFEKAKANVSKIHVVGLDAPSKDKPDAHCAAFDAELPDVELMRMVYGGTKTMRAAGEEALPAHPREEAKELETRTKIAVSFNALQRTVNGLTGMVFRKDPVSEGVPENIAAHLENIDQQGRDVSVWLRDLFEQALIDGGAWIHVEMPKPKEFKSKAEEQQSKRQPYWVAVSKQDAINWRYTMVDGKPVLTLFVYREADVRQAGTFGSETVIQYRVLRPGSWEVWEKDGKTFRVVDSGLTSLSYIPVVWYPTKRDGVYRSSPPLLDLAYENVEFYRVRSDRRTALTYTIATPVFTGAAKKDVEMGANRALFFPSSEVKAGMLEATGASLVEWREELNMIRGNMAALGLAMLVRETRAAETAEAKEIDKSETDSALAAAARGLSDTANNLLMIHGDYLGVSEPGEIKVNRKFRHLSLDPQALAEYHKLVQEGNLSIDTLWAMMVEMEGLPEEFDADEERERLESHQSSELEQTRALLSSMQAAPEPADPEQVAA